MDVLVAGGHGKVAIRLLAALAERGDRARGLIRNPAHAPDLETEGAEPVIADLEALEAAGLAPIVEGSDAVVFAAGAGPGSGAARKRTVDLGGALKLIEACEAAGVRRYVIVSAMGVDHPEAWSEQMRPYFEAKRKADEALRASGLGYSVVRPGGLIDDAPTGAIEVGTPLDHRGQVTRADVAATLLAVLDEPRTIGLTFDLIGGETPIDEAIASLVAERDA